MKKTIRLAFLISFLTLSLIQAQTMRTHTAPGLGDYLVPFYPDGTYLPDVKSPDEFFGLILGSRPTSHPEVLQYFEYLAETFSNAELHEYGETYEGRRLIYLTITSEDNFNRLERIREDIGKLADPRKLKNKHHAERIINSTPAIAWMAYAIHGDELSSTDAALQLAYQLLAGTDELTRKIRNNVVVCIDPLQNPDGRTRFLGQLEQWNGAIPSTDIQSFHHRGTWPWGRGNHYLFDLNRDWFTTVHPETRVKTRAILDWHPQLVVDSHEMGALNTYLFNPPRAPFNPFMPKMIYKWWKKMSDDHAAAFDKYGWSYYTREWNEELFPGYGSSWSIFTGAVGLLYEQAGVDGSQVKRQDGTIMTYRESVHHQFVSSISNLSTVANNQEELLRDYYEIKQIGVGSLGGKRLKSSAAFVFPPGDNKSRLVKFGETLQRQDIEVEEVQEEFKLRRAISRFGDESKDVDVPKGALIIRLNQPNQALIRAILTFDIRLPSSVLEKEKRSRLKHGETELYETTGWSMSLAYDLDAFYLESLPPLKSIPFKSPKSSGSVVGIDPAYGYVFSNADDKSFNALADLFESGVKVWCAEEPFEIEGKKFPRGSFLIRLHANPDLDVGKLESIAEKTGITIYGVNTGLATSGSDLGGNDFILLRPSHVAIVGGTPISFYSFGAAWHLLDSRINMRVSTLEAIGLSNTDLSKYNVLVLPSVWGSPSTYKRILGDDGIKRLKDWVTDGGTLIGIGTAAAFLADTSVALTSVRQKRQVLDKLSSYEGALRRSIEAETPMIDSLDVWEVRPKEEVEGEKEQKEAKDSEIKSADEFARKLSPGGVILRTELDEEHWLSFGCGEDVPTMVNTSYAYLAKGGVEVPSRFAESERLRLSGLLWPEARERWNQTVYSARDASAKGQVIMFATEPNFRAYFHGTERMFLNAVFLGPGFGTKQTVDW